MTRLAGIIYGMVGPTLAGTLIVAALVAGLDSVTPILIAAGVGFAAGVPVAWAIARRLAQTRR